MRGFIVYGAALGCAFIGCSELAFGASMRLPSARVESAVTDSSVGKSPWLVMMTENPSADVTVWKDLTMLNGSLPWVINETPPRGAGPGLQYDSHKYFYVYTDYHAPQNHFSPSGWMGDYGDIRIDDRSTDDPADGKTCIKITYSAKRSQGAGWAGMYWQQPDNNWGNRFGGYDLSGKKRVTFWVKGAQGGEVIAEFKVGGISGTFEDSGSAHIGPVVLPDHWEQLAIDLSNVDLKHITGGFAWSASADQNRQGMAFYLDEIRFEQ